ncbi:hypothetical protein BDY19DRAFT_983336 [Irpex rosettiformis]|uniref:Uncharacterized protein n=1 Tax=Irpex rosettiformis TaxID=378272 RepID=A0ACB8UEL7_9APHY|nr:hypothetical protein BDY19DRAFT_983336 [Irpex rosettiformis]
MSIFLRSLTRTLARPAYTTCKPFPSQHFTGVLFAAARPTSFGTRGITTGHLRPLVQRETSLSQLIQDSIRYATHKSRRFRPVGRGSGGSGSSGYGNRGNSWRPSFQDRIPDNAIIWGILAVNGLVYLAWQRAIYDYKSLQDPTPYIWLRENFTTSAKNLREGRIWTLLTSAFSHEGAGHIFVNSLTFFFMAPPVLSALGKPAFFVLYLGGGLVSSLTSLWFNNVYKPKPNYSSHGASGAMYAVISFLACAAPRATFQLYGIIPVPAWLCVSGLFLYDVYSSINDKQEGTDTAGHVGGVLGGICYFLARRFRIF